MVKYSNFIHAILIATTTVLGISGCATYLPVTMVAEGRQYSVVVAVTLDSGFDVTVTDAATFIAMPDRKEIQGPLLSVYMSTIEETCPEGIKQVIPIPLPLSTSKKARVYCSDGVQRNLAKISEEDTSEKSGGFPKSPAVVSFPRASINANDLAVIIGNADYKKGKDIPNVTPAYADAEGIKRYFTQALGVQEENIIHLKDATGSQLAGVFGNERSYKGKLFNWVKPGISKVYVYYAGHGVPAGDEGSAFMVPSDASVETISLTGYPLSTLYKNLSQIPAKSITVILEACFSGASQGGTLISNASPIYLKAKTPNVPSNVTVISAGAANQMASWEKDKSHSLFTKYFLKGMSGEADAKPYGNADGKADYVELQKYLDGTMTYFARRYYGRTQNAQIVNGKLE